MNYRSQIGIHTYDGVEISEYCSWDTRVAKVTGKDKAQAGKMDAILTDSHFYTRIKRCILMKVDSTGARICRRSIGREREARKSVGNSTDDSS